MVSLLAESLALDNKSDTFLCAQYQNVTQNVLNFSKTEGHPLENEMQNVQFEIVIGFSGGVVMGANCK